MHIGWCSVHTAVHPQQKPTDSERNSQQDHTATAMSQTPRAYFSLFTLDQLSLHQPHICVRVISWFWHFVHTDNTLGGARISAFLQTL